MKKLNSVVLCLLFVFLLASDLISNVVVLATEQTYVENFENFAFNAAKPAPWGGNMVIWHTENLANGKLEIVDANVDVATHGKAMKFTKNYTNALNTVLTAAPRFNPLIGDFIKVKYDFRSETHNQYLQNFPGISGSYNDGTNKSTKSIGVQSNGNQLLFMKNGSYPNDRTIAFNDLTTTTGWHTYETIMNIKMKIYDLYIDGTLKASNLDLISPTTAYQGLGALDFNLKSDKTTATTDAVYWIDNLEIGSLDPLSVSTTAATLDVPVWNRNFEFTFNKTMSTISDSDVEITKGGVVVPTTSYTKTISDKKLTVTFNSNLDYVTNYAIKIKKNVKSGVLPAVSMLADYTYSFTTEVRDLDEVLLQNFEGLSVGDFVNPGGTVNWYPGLATGDVGDSIRIETDPVRNTKALKFTKKDITNNKYINVALRQPSIVAPIIKVKYDFRAEAHKQYVANGGNIGLVNYSGGVTTNNGSIPILSSGKNLLIQAQSGNKTMLSTTGDNPNQWYTFEMVINTITDTFDFYRDGVLIESNLEFTYNNGQRRDIDGIGGLDFQIKTINVGGGDGIYWFDNIKISTPTPNLNVLLDGQVSQYLFSGVVSANVDVSASILNPVTLILAQYQDNKLIKIVTDNSTTQGNRTLSCSLGSVEASSGTSVKAMLFKGLENITPLMVAKQLVYPN